MCLQALARDAVCHRNADFCPKLRGDRIGPQGVRVVTVEHLQIQARHSITSPKCASRTQKGRNESQIESFDYLGGFGFS